MAALPRRCAVLIVGAGPTGLVLAIRLRQLGVDCLLIDKQPAPLPWSRALGLHARTLEILEALDVLSSVRKRSVQLKAMHIHNEKGPLFDLDMTGLDAPFPWVLCVPQAEVEQCLCAQYKALGGHIERGVELVEFTQGGHSVDTSLRVGDETVSIEAQLLIGCDGAGSFVRQTLGLSFDGVEHHDHFLLTDVELDWSLDKASAHAFLLAEGALLALPLPVGWRLVLNLPSEDDSHNEEALTLEPFKRRLDAIFQQQSSQPVPALGEAVWLSRFSIQRRLAGRYRVNRVLLAGDACHIQSPVGAQGMNTGIADAFNLAWKVALFVQGVGGGELLDSYETERRPIAKTMLNGVDMVSRYSFARNFLVRGARDSVLKMIAKQPRVAARLLRRMSQLDVNYRNSAIVGSGTALFSPLGTEGPKPGDRMPDALLKEMNSGESLRLQDFLRDPRHQLFIQLSSDLDHQEIVAAFALADRVPSEFAEHVRTIVIIADGLPDALRQLSEFDVNILHDDDGGFCHRYGPAGLWLMRPDGHLGYRAPISDSDQLLHYLRELLSKR